VKWFGCLCVFALLSGCNLSDRGLAKLQVVDELVLGAGLDEIKEHWFNFSIKRLQVEQTISNESFLVYRGVSRDPGVTSFYLFFRSKDKTLEKVEWRYHSSMTAVKEKELLDYWSKQLWAPSYHQRWEGKVFVWSDRKARLELYLADGICHLIHRLN
jgi:hypothetical protein